MHIKQALTSTARSAAVAVPAYNRHAAPPAIVHFGVGNFVRAHLCAYTDAVLNQQSTTTSASSSASPASSLDEPFWGIHGVGVVVLRAATAVAGHGGGDDGRPGLPLWADDDALGAGARHWLDR